MPNDRKSNQGGGQQVAAKKAVAVDKVAVQGAVSRLVVSKAIRVISKAADEKTNAEISEVGTVVGWTKPA